MKWVFVLVALCLALIPALPQVRITNGSRDGVLLWSNCLSTLGFSNTNQPIYSVEWANSATGTWQRAALVTNAQSFHLGELVQQAQPTLFARVAWMNATSAPPVGAYQITMRNASGGVAHTGIVELTSVNGTYVNGNWVLHPPSPTGRTNGWVAGSVSAMDVQLNLGAGAEGPFLLGGAYTGDGFAGTWFSCGVVCVPSGGYTARRVCP